MKNNRTDVETRKVSFNIPVKFDKLIKSSGKNRSDFIKTALEYYVLHIQDPYNKVILKEFEQWIQKKRSEIDSIEHNTNSIQDNTNSIRDNTSVLHSNIESIQNNTDNTIVIQKQAENTAKTTDSNLEKKIAEELPILHDLLNNPENMDTVPDFTLKKLSKKYDISKSYLQTWITQNKTWLKTTEFEEDL